MIINNRIIFRQLFDRTSCTYTYLLGCRTTGEAVLIDPVKELAERDVQLARQLNLQLKYVMNTHVHADHVTGSGRIKQMFPPGAVSSVISRRSGARADIHVADGDTLPVGDNIRLSVIETPGHTTGCVSYFFAAIPAVFTGDTLLIRGCGRTDFQQGDAGQLYQSVHRGLFTLPGESLVYPGHDYNGQTCSTIGEEKQFNPRLTKSQEEFVELMKNLKLDLPKLIDIAVPQNMVCGI